MNWSVARGGPTEIEISVYLLGLGRTRNEGHTLFEEVQSEITTVSAKLVELVTGRTVDFFDRYCCWNGERLPRNDRIESTIARSELGLKEMSFVCERTRRFL